MIETDILIVGGGPAGMAAAITATSYSKNVMLIERDGHLGGQLVKQTHMFFGSEKQQASVRGFDIAKKMVDELHTIENLKIINKATVVGMFEDGVVMVHHRDGYFKIKPKAMIVATGAFEKSLAFQGNTLPGVYGAGAVQTLMNLQGIKPGQEVVMVGAGNIGLIVSYQLMQAGVKVNAIVDAAPSIGGYVVHAAKVRRMGVPIYTKYTVKKALGSEHVEGAILCKLDDKYQPIEGQDIEVKCDILCVSIGLSPLSELLWQLKCEMTYVGVLGGYVPKTNEKHETSQPGVFVAGDVSGIEEASSAMIEGYLTGLYVNEYLGVSHQDIEDKILKYDEELKALRAGPLSEKIRIGIEQTRF